MADEHFPPHMATDCAHAGEGELVSESTPSVMPIYQSSVFDFSDLALVDDVWEGKKPGFIYGRYGLPNQAALEQIVARLENAESALASASGMAAIAVAILTLAGKGDEIVLASDTYGGTLSLATRDLGRLGMVVRFVQATDHSAVEGAVSPDTRVLLVESISNPLGNVVDLAAVADLCHRKGVKLLVDNTVATPYLLRPLAMGADVVIHSGTKFLGGHHDVTAGIVGGNTTFVERARQLAIRFGVSLGPMDAWLAVRGIKTFTLRMERICSNALAVAEFLENHAKVQRVYYPGLPSHPQYNLVRRTMRGLGGGIVSFELKGGLREAEEFVKGLKLIRFAPSFGGVATTITHPAKTSHRSLMAAQRAEAGIKESLLRLSVGIEEREDILRELWEALEPI